MKTYDLTDRHQRYQARKAGLDVPKLRPGKPAKDFWGQVDKSGECWLWTGRLNRDGYGLYAAEGRSFRAHRYVLERFHGVSVENKIVMHSCDNPSCCNPDHLSVGTHVDNQMDKIGKNRQAKGELCGTSILKEKQVLEMRSKYSSGGYTYQMLADEYGVNKDTAQKAVRGINWGHL